MVKANNRTLALFLKIWEESEHHWKFLSLLFKCQLSSLSIAIYSKQFGWVGVEGRGRGLLLGQARGKETEGRGSGYGGWGGGFSKLWMPTTFSMQPNWHKMNHPFILTKDRSSRYNSKMWTHNFRINLHLFLEWFSWVIFINICVCIKYGSVDL